MNNKLKVIILLLLISSFLLSKTRAIWIPIWEVTSKEKIDNLLTDVKTHDFDKMLVQVRYRGDVAYFPNKFNSYYPNKENKYHAIADSLFDPLGYIIDHARKLDIEVHAWFPTFVITGHDLSKLDPANPYFTNPEWITVDNTGNKMDYDSYEGAFLDPGITEVQNYTESVIMDIAANYDVDGIHLDYIRYPDSYFGYNLLARKKYISAIKEPSGENWSKWKEEQITAFVRKIHNNLKKTAPTLQLTAAVIPDINKAVKRYSQNWLNWLETGIIDQVYLMEYTTSTTTLESNLNFASQFKQNNNIIVGLRAWSTQFTYPSKKINEKIKLVNASNFAGYALYSYTGIIGSNYFESLKY